VKHVSILMNKHIELELLNLGMNSMVNSFYGGIIKIVVLFSRYLCVLKQVHFHMSKHCFSYFDECVFF